MGKDIHVWRALNSPFEFIGSRPGKDGVRMRIDEAGENDFSIRIEIGRILVGKLIRRTGPLNDSITNRDGTVVDDAEVTQLKAAPSAGWPGHSQQLAGMDDV